MTLKEWIKIQNIAIKQFALKIGVSRSQVHKYLYEGARPGKEVVIRIFKVTNKAVTPNDFYGITFEMTLPDMPKQKTQSRCQCHVKN